MKHDDYLRRIVENVTRADERCGGPHSRAKQRRRAKVKAFKDKALEGNKCPFEDAFEAGFKLAANRSKDTSLRSNMAKVGMSFHKKAENPFEFGTDDWETWENEFESGYRQGEKQGGSTDVTDNSELQMYSGESPGMMREDRED